MEPRPAIQHGTILTDDEDWPRPVAVGTPNRIVHGCLAVWIALEVVKEQDRVGMHEGSNAAGRLDPIFIGVGLTYRAPIVQLDGSAVEVEIWQIRMGLWACEAEGQTQAHMTKWNLDYHPQDIHCSLLTIEMHKVDRVSSIPLSQVVLESPAALREPAALLQALPETQHPGSAPLLALSSSVSPG